MKYNKNRIKSSICNKKTRGEKKDENYVRSACLFWLLDQDQIAYNTLLYGRLSVNTLRDYRAFIAELLNEFWLEIDDCRVQNGFSVDFFCNSSLN